MYSKITTNFISQLRFSPWLTKILTYILLLLHLFHIKVLCNVWHWDPLFQHGWGGINFGFACITFDFVVQQGSGNTYDCCIHDYLYILQLFIIIQTVMCNGRPSSMGWKFSGKNLLTHKPPVADAYNLLILWLISSLFQGRLLRCISLINLTILRQQCKLQGDSTTTVIGTKSINNLPMDEVLFSTAAEPGNFPWVLQYFASRMPYTGNRIARHI